MEREELAIVPCRGEGPYASCPKIRRAVEAGTRFRPWKERLRRSHLKWKCSAAHWFRLPRPRLNSLGHLRAASGSAGVVDQERQRYEELRGVEARREESVKTLERLNEARSQLIEELKGKESVVGEFSGLDAQKQAYRREIEPEFRSWTLILPS